VAESQRLDVVRRGGIAGGRAHASVDLASLPPGVAESVEAVLSGRVRASPLAGRADTFTYELSSGEGSARRSATVAEHDLPEDLAPLLGALRGQWRLS
jgi:hypothetical protein